METLDAEGLAGLSMRKLAAKLGSGATSLYWHVPTKDDLIDLLIDEVWGEIDVPDPGLAGWRSGALLFAHSLRSVVLRHPWLPEVMYTRPSMGPNAMTHGHPRPGPVRRRRLHRPRRRLRDGQRDVVRPRQRERRGRRPASWPAAVRPLARRAGHRRLQQAATASPTTPRCASPSAAASTGDIGTALNDSFVFGLDALLDGLADPRQVQLSAEPGFVGPGSVAAGILAVRRRLGEHAAGSCLRPGRCLGDLAPG